MTKPIVSLLKTTKFHTWSWAKHTSFGHALTNMVPLKCNVALARHSWVLVESTYFSTITAQMDACTMVYTTWRVIITLRYRTCRHSSVKAFETSKPFNWFEGGVYKIDHDYCNCLHLYDFNTCQPCNWTLLNMCWYCCCQLVWNLYDTTRQSTVSCSLSALLKPLQGSSITIVIQIIVLPNNIS